MEIQAFAPGRVEWLGNHTDYNQGYVLSAALESGTTIKGKKREDDMISLYSVRFDEKFETEASKLKPLAEKHWSNYVTGVAAELAKRNEIGGFEAVIMGDVPIGAGLASSASLTVSTALMLCQLFKIILSKPEMAQMAQAAEHNFAGVKCGLLDQISAIYGVRDQAIFIDFRTLEVKNVQVPKSVELVIVNSGVKHSLVTGEYNERRSSCESAAKKLGKQFLRDIDMKTLERDSSKLNDLEFRRAKHIVGENQRVRSAIEALRANDIARVGQLMLESHSSSMDNFENSISEIDYLISVASSIEGCYGARLTGGGFGGATINLVDTEAIADFGRKISRSYKKRYGFEPEIFVTRPGSGAA